MHVAIVVAHDEDRVIGHKNSIPWHVPADLKLFKTRTLCMPVVMGRKTYESIPEKFRPLPSRLNIVVSSDPTPFNNGHPSLAGVYSLEAAIELARIRGYLWVYLAGGGRVYQEALDKGLVDKIYVSLIPGKHEGDTFFPQLDANTWEVTKIEQLEGFQLFEYTKRVS